MAGDLILKTHQKPTLFNTESRIGLMAAVLLAPATPIGLVAIVATAIIGGLIGKRRMEHEATHGKKISENYNPLNLGTLDSGISGAIAGGLIGLVLSTFGIAVPVVAAIATVVGGAVLGVVAGSALGARHHAAEYEQAKQQAIVRHLSNTVSPEVGSAVEYAMDHNKSWTKDVVQDRMLADTQHRQI